MKMTFKTWKGLGMVFYLMTCGGQMSSCYENIYVSECYTLWF